MMMPHHQRHPRPSGQGGTLNGPMKSGSGILGNAPNVYHGNQRFPGFLASPGNTMGNFPGHTSTSLGMPVSRNNSVATCNFLENLQSQLSQSPSMNMPGAGNQAGNNLANLMNNSGLRNGVNPQMPSNIQPSPGNNAESQIALVSNLLKNIGGANSANAHLSGNMNLPNAPITMGGHYGGGSLGNQLQSPRPGLGPPPGVMGWTPGMTGPRLAPGSHGNHFHGNQHDMMGRLRHCPHPNMLGPRAVLNRQGARPMGGGLLPTPSSLNHNPVTNGIDSDRGRFSGGHGNLVRSGFPGRRQRRDSQSSQGSRASWNGIDNQSGVGEAARGCGEEYDPADPTDEPHLHPLPHHQHQQHPDHRQRAGVQTVSALPPAAPLGGDNYNPDHRPSQHHRPNDYPRNRPSNHHSDPLNNHPRPYPNKHNSNYSSIYSSSNPTSQGSPGGILPAPRSPTPVPPPLSTPSRPGGNLGFPISFPAGSPGLRYPPPSVSRNSATPTLSSPPSSALSVMLPPMNAPPPTASPSPTTAPYPPPATAPYSSPATAPYPTRRFPPTSVSQDVDERVRAEFSAEQGSSHSSGSVGPQLKRQRSVSPVYRHSNSSNDRMVADHIPDMRTPMKRRGEIDRIAEADGKYFCHACSVKCKSLTDFDQHMNSSCHRQRMHDILTIHSATTERIKAHDPQSPPPEAQERADFCKICDRRFHGSVLYHHKTDEHKRKDRLTKKGCILCKTGAFDTYPEYVAHIDSAPHKEAKAQLAAQKAAEAKGIGGDNTGRHGNPSFTDSKEESYYETSYQDDELQYIGTRHRQDDHEEDCSMFPENIDEMVTVDATGIFEEEMEEESPGGPQKRRVIPRSARDQLAHETHSDSGIAMSMDILAADLVFDPDTPVGDEFVIPVQGFFCKLCHKFYNSEEMAKVAHCKTEKHFEKFQKLMEFRQKQMKQQQTTAVKASREVVPQHVPLPMPPHHMGSPAHQPTSTLTRVTPSHRQSPGLVTGANKPVVRSVKNSAQNVVHRASASPLATKAVSKNGGEQKTDMSGRSRTLVKKQVRTPNASPKATPPRRQSLQSPSATPVYDSSSVTPSHDVLFSPWMPAPMIPITESAQAKSSRVAKSPKGTPNVVAKPLGPKRTVVASKSVTNTTEKGLASSIVSPAQTPKPRGQATSLTKSKQSPAAASTSRSPAAGLKPAQKPNSKAASAKRSTNQSTNENNVSEKSSSANKSPAVARKPQPSNTKASSKPAGSGSMPSQPKQADTKTAAGTLVKKVVQAVKGSKLAPRKSLKSGPAQMKSPKQVPQSKGASDVEIQFKPSPIHASSPLHGLEASLQHNVEASPRRDDITSSSSSAKVPVKSVKKKPLFLAQVKMSSPSPKHSSETVVMKVANSPSHDVQQELVLPEIEPKLTTLSSLDNRHLLGSSSSPNDVLQEETHPETSVEEAVDCEEEIQDKQNELEYHMEHKPNETMPEERTAEYHYTDDDEYVYEEPTNVQTKSSTQKTNPLRGLVDYDDDESEVSERDDQRSHTANSYHEEVNDEVPNEDDGGEDNEYYAQELDTNVQSPPTHETTKYEEENGVFGHVEEHKQECVAHEDEVGSERFEVNEEADVNEEQHEEPEASEVDEEEAAPGSNYDQDEMIYEEKPENMQDQTDDLEDTNLVDELVEEDETAKVEEQLDEDNPEYEEEYYEGEADESNEVEEEYEVEEENLENTIPEEQFDDESMGYQEDEVIDEHEPVEYAEQEDEDDNNDAQEDGEEEPADANDQEHEVDEDWQDGEYEAVGVEEAEQDGEVEEAEEDEQELDEFEQDEANEGLTDEEEAEEEILNDVANDEDEEQYINEVDEEMDEVEERGQDMDDVMDTEHQQTSLEEVAEEGEFEANDEEEEEVMHIEAKDQAMETMGEELNESNEEFDDTEENAVESAMCIDKMSDANPALVNEKAKVDLDQQELNDTTEEVEEQIGDDVKCSSELENVTELETGAASPITMDEPDENKNHSKYSSKGSRTKKDVKKDKHSSHQDELETSKDKKGRKDQEKNLKKDRKGRNGEKEPRNRSHSPRKERKRKHSVPDDEDEDEMLLSEFNKKDSNKLQSGKLKDLNGENVLDNDQHKGGNTADNEQPKQISENMSPIVELTQLPTSKIRSSRSRKDKDTPDQAEVVEKETSGSEEQSPNHTRTSHVKRRLKRTVLAQT